MKRRMNKRHTEKQVLTESMKKRYKVTEYSEVGYFWDRTFSMEAGSQYHALFMIPDFFLTLIDVFIM